MIYEAFNIKVCSDIHNTHDTMVNELSKRYYTHLLENTQINLDIYDVLRDINALTQFKYNTTDKNLIFNYINFIAVNYNYIVNFDCNECDFFVLCWNNSANSSNVENIQHNILHNILDFYTDGTQSDSNIIIKKFCCTTGRIIRLLSSFCFMDPINTMMGSFISRCILKKEFLFNASLCYNDEIDKTEYTEKLDSIINSYNWHFHTELHKIKDSEIIPYLYFNKKK